MPEAADSEGCPICYEDFNVPCALPCGHVFCKACITQALAVPLASRRDRPSCPVCRKPSLSPPIRLYLPTAARAVAPLAPPAPAPSLYTGPAIPRQKTWAEATVPLDPVIAASIRNLRDSLAASEVTSRNYQNQLNQAVSKQNQIDALNKRLSSERDQAQLLSHQLQSDNVQLRKLNAAYLGAGQELHRHLSEVEGERNSLRNSLEIAEAVVHELRSRLGET
ncbi:hypothetical protein DL93DRAFT_2093303 [Clavulina sp. PMI_390]|nr:hypothetical protein DL93DRAFT_2093303 [Clavulina sp. PMI_390]